MTTEEKLQELKQAALPLIKYLNTNYHPHVTAIITPTSVELLEGILNVPKILDFVKKYLIFKILYFSSEDGELNCFHLTWATSTTNR